MKIKKRIGILTALALMLMMGFTVQAQSSQEEQKQKQLEQEEQIREKEMQLKKQHLEQEKKMAEMERAYAVQERASSRAREASRVYTRSSGFGDESSYFIYSGGQENQSQLTLRNSFNGETVSSSGDFVVDESTSHIRLTINGKVRHGEIVIRVLLPGGKEFKDLTINSSAEIAFSQSLTIKDEEKKKYVGAWKYEVKTKTAEGNYSLSIMTH